MVPSLKLQKIEEKATIPTRATKGSAGFDFYSIEDKCIAPGLPTLIKTGIRCAIPEGYVGIIKARSGLAFRAGIDVMAGVIDSDYRGEVGVILTSVEDSVYIKAGDAVAQMVVVPFLRDSVQLLMEESLDETERGENGYGSTDTKRAASQAEKLLSMFRNLSSTKHTVLARDEVYEKAKNLSVENTISYNDASEEFKFEDNSVLSISDVACYINPVFNKE